MANGSEIKNILERNWKEGKEELPTLFENVEKIRSWTVVNGKRKNVHGNFKSVYEESENNLTYIEAVDIERYPDTFDVLDGEVLSFSTVLDEYKIEFRFFMAVERTNAPAIIEELDLSLFPDTQIETRIDYIADEDEEVVEFPKRSAYSLSGDEIKVASFFLQEFVDEKKIHIV